MAKIIAPEEMQSAHIGRPKGSKYPEEWFDGQARLFDDGDMAGARFEVFRNRMTTQAVLRGLKMRSRKVSDHSGYFWFEVK